MRCLRSKHQAALFSVQWASWQVVFDLLTKAGVVNVEKPRVGTLVACCLREALDVSLEVSGVHGSQVARCNQPFPCSGPSDIYATVDGTVVRQSNVLYSLERKTSGVRAHYDPVQDMASLVRWHVHELKQVLVVQQSTGQHRHWKSLQNES